MSGCEHGELWKPAARFIKYDEEEIRDDQCIKIPGFHGNLWQYQYLTVYTMLLFQLTEGKNGVINAEEPGLGKVSSYVICRTRFIQLISYGFRRLRHLPCF